VLRGVYLEPNAYLSAQGRPLRPEVADLMVVGPSGVFVIGVSAAAQLAPREERLARTAELCALLLEAARLPGAVRAIAGAEAWGGTATAELCAQVSSAGAKVLAPREIEAVVAYLLRSMRRGTAQHGGLRLVAPAGWEDRRDCGAAHRVQVRRT
jgi:hypothetical protein